MTPSEERELDPASGRYRSVVTCLEMSAPPDEPPPAAPRPAVRVLAWEPPDVAAYLELFRRVGEPWLWYGRLEESTRAIAERLAEPGYGVWRLCDGPEVLGLGELDQRTPGETEITYFGLVPAAIGRGLGGFFLRTLVHQAWQPAGVDRVWLHTCTEDHPDALAIYQRVGFRPFDRRVEWVRDPRLRGLLPRGAGPHVPIPE